MRDPVEIHRLACERCALRDGERSRLVHCEFDGWKEVRVLHLGSHVCAGGEGGTAIVWKYGGRRGIMPPSIESSFPYHHGFRTTEHETA